MKTERRNKKKRAYLMDTIIAHRHYFPHLFHSPTHFHRWQAFHFPQTPTFHFSNFQFFTSFISDFPVELCGRASFGIRKWFFLAAATKGLSVCVWTYRVQLILSLGSHRPFFQVKLYYSILFELLALFRV